MKKDILSEVAKAHGVSREEVEKEIRAALLAAMKSNDPIAKAFWKNQNLNPKTNSIEKVISDISKEVGASNKTKKV